MATYAVGDVQGCRADLEALLDKLRFDPAHDRLWLTGDLVNRGPDSLGVLRLVRGLGEAAVTVLGNHDLHLLACRFVPGRAPKAHDTFGDVLAAPDGDSLLHWLRQQPLLHHDAALAVTMVHAGLPPQWTLQEAKACAAEVGQALRGESFRECLQHMYGNEPSRWTPTLVGHERHRFTINALTRMRFVTADGALDFAAKGAPGSAGDALLPWYAVPTRRTRRHRVVFGHWSTLRLSREEERACNVVPLDTGAIWGGTLTAWRLGSEMRVAVPGSTPVPLDE